VGVGNIFLGDDGFGVALVQRLINHAWPLGVTIVDIGLRSLHLAYELLEPPQLLIVADAVARRGAPGTLYLLEPDLSRPSAEWDRGPHGLTLASVASMVERLGGRMPRVFLVGCEPQSLAEGMDLSEPVQMALLEAGKWVHELVDRELAGDQAKTPCRDKD
jgi:hydrogenase maturation protease